MLKKDASLKLRIMTLFMQLLVVAVVIINIYGTAQVQRRTHSPVLCLNLDYSLRLSLAVLAQNLRESRLNSLELLAQVTQVV